MTSTTAEKPSKLIHVARIFIKGEHQYLFLRKLDPVRFTWFRDCTRINCTSGLRQSPDMQFILAQPLTEENKETEKETDVTAPNIEEALRLANRAWKSEFFTTVICGFRYTLPERDEHGINALFHQMVSSYSSMNGIYYDEELGNNCFVQSASEEAYRLWQRLKTQKRL